MRVSTISPRVTRHQELSVRAPGTRSSSRCSITTVPIDGSLRANLAARGNLGPAQRSPLDVLRTGNAPTQSCTTRAHLEELRQQPWTQLRGTGRSQRKLGFVGATRSIGSLASRTTTRLTFLGRQEESQLNTPNARQRLLATYLNVSRPRPTVTHNPNQQTGERAPPIRRVRRSGPAR